MAEVDIHAPGVECIKTQCYFCHANCGVLAYVKDGEVIKIEGDPDYTNQGGLCCRGTSALLHVNHPGRVNHALKRAGEKGEGKWEQIDYDQAIQEVADRINQIKEENGAEAVASAGGTTRTDDWARRRFLNQFGTPNGFHNALLCWIPTFMAETCVAGWSPFETDLGGAKSLILWGMNPGASTLPSMHGYWDLIQNGMKTIVVDPRYSETAAKADLWLPLLPGTDCALALSLLYCAVMEGLCNFDFCTQWCDGFEELMAHVGEYTPEWASEITGLDAELIRKAAAMYCTNTPGCIQWGCTWDQLGRSSTTTSHALQLLRAVTGNLEVPGGDGMPGPIMNALCDEELELNELLPEEQKAKQIGSNKFRLTSWPGYTLISKTNKRTWGKTLPTEWFCEAHGPSVFRAILTKDPYEIRALIVNATNPMMSYGDSKMVLAAIKAVEFLVVVDYWITPTALFADYVFPAAGALERPTIITHYGATDSVMGGRRAIQPMYDRHTDMTFWRKLGLACGQDPANWPWETEEEAYWAIIQSIGLPVSSYNEFVDKIRMYYPPLHQSKYISRGAFWTPTGKVELNSTILQELGYPGMPTYIGCSENPLDDPEVAKEYPIRLTTGGGFMPYHHSEHFNMPYTRYLSPDPYFFINPELAEKLNIKQYDWCWIETRRGRIKMRADLDNIIDPRAIMCPRGWWFPERDGSADLDNPFGCLESNVNVLTSVDDEHCDPMGGSWANRGLLCKVYKCVDGDTEFTYNDTKWAIPGSDARKGKTVEEAVHRMPSEVIKAREDIPFEKPKPDVEVPEGFEWQWQDKQLYHIKTNFKRDEAGWIVDPKTKKQYDAHTMWRFDPATNLLVDDETGTTYDMQRRRAQYWGSILCYPGLEEAPYELPESVTWDVNNGVGMAFGKPYDSNSGWCIDPETNVYYDSFTGYSYDATNDVLLDEAGNWYDKETRARIQYWGTLKCYPGLEEAPYELPEGIAWSTERGIGMAFGHPYNVESGWCVDPVSNVFYDAYTGLAFDPTQNNLVDEASGYRYDMTTRAALDGGPDILEAVKDGAPRPEGLPTTALWDAKTGLASAFGHPYDPASGWCIDPITNVYYDAYTGLALDSARDCLVDEQTGYHYNKDTREPIDGGEDVLDRSVYESLKNGFPQQFTDENGVLCEYYFVYEPDPVAMAAAAAAAAKEAGVGAVAGAGAGAGALGTAILPEAVVGKYEFDENVPGSMPSCKAKIDKTVTNYKFDENVAGSMPARKPIATTGVVGAAAASAAGTAASAVAGVAAAGTGVVQPEAVVGQYVFDEAVPGSMPSCKAKINKTVKNYKFDENVAGSMPARKPIATASAAGAGATSPAALMGAGGVAAMAPIAGAGVSADEAVVGRYEFDEAVPGSMPSCKAKIYKTVKNYTFDENVAGSMPAHKPIAGLVQGAPTEREVKNYFAPVPEGFRLAKRVRPVVAEAAGAGEQNAATAGGAATSAETGAVVEQAVIQPEAIVGKYEFDEAVPGSMPSCKAKLNKTVTNYSFDAAVPGSMPARKPIATIIKVAGSAGAGVAGATAAMVEKVVVEPVAVVGKFVFSESEPGSMPSCKEKQNKTVVNYKFDAAVPGSMPSRKPTATTIKVSGGAAAQVIEEAEAIVAAAEDAQSSVEKYVFDENVAGSMPASKDRQVKSGKTKKFDENVPGSMPARKPRK